MLLNKLLANRVALRKVVTAAQYSRKLSNQTTREQQPNVANKLAQIEPTNEATSSSLQTTQIEPPPKPNKEGPVNAKVIWRDDDTIRRHETEYRLEPDPVILPDPVKQELIARIPVEYHGTLAKHFNNETEWLPIFRMPYVGRFRSLIRAKLYVTGLSLGMTGYKIFESVVSFHWPSSSAVLLATGSLAMLFYAGDYFRRIACYIYVTRDMRFVRFARFTFFGTRRDLVLPIEQVIPLPELNASYRLPLFKMGFWLPEKIDLDNDELEFYDEGLRMFVKWGGILDRERFKIVMGNVFIRVNE